MRLEPEVKTYKKRRELTPPSISPSKEPYPEIEADIAPFSRNEYRVQREYSLGMGTSLLPPQIHLVKSAKRERDSGAAVSNYSPGTLLSIRSSSYP